MTFICCYDRIISVENLFIIIEFKGANMKATGVVRCIDELGRLVIPKEIRTNMDIRCADPLEIFVDGDDIIILRKHRCTCVFCQSSEQLTEYKGKKICSGCLDQLKGV